MKALELINLLLSIPPETEIVLKDRYGYSNGYSTNSDISLNQGYFVRDEYMTNYGGFVDKVIAHSRCESGQTFLDFSSPYISPCVQLWGGR